MGKERSFHLNVTCKTRNIQGRNEEETMAGHKETQKLHIESNQHYQI